MLPSVKRRAQATFGISLFIKCEMPSSYFFPFVQLQPWQSIWPFSSVVCPPLHHGVTLTQRLQSRKVMTRLTIISFSAGRASAIMTVSATSGESAMRLDPSLPAGVARLYRNSDRFVGTRSIGGIADASAFSFGRSDGS